MYSVTSFKIEENELLFEELAKTAESEHRYFYFRLLMHCFYEYLNKQIVGFVGFFFLFGFR